MKKKSKISVSLYFTFFLIQTHTHHTIPFDERDDDHHYNNFFLFYLWGKAIWSGSYTIFFMFNFWLFHDGNS